MRQEHKQKAETGSVTDQHNFLQYILNSADSENFFLVNFLVNY